MKAAQSTKPGTYRSNFPEKFLNLIHSFKPGNPFDIVTKPIPEPGDLQVLIKVKNIFFMLTVSQSLI